MVSRGQYLERPAIVRAGDIFLEGLYHRGELPPATLICPPIDEELGMDLPPVAELAFACARAGRASLRFQHRGFGASEGSRDPSLALADAEFALVHLAETDGQVGAVAGVMSGCRTAVSLAARATFLRTILVLPPVGLELPERSGRVLAIFPELCDPEPLGWWKDRLRGRAHAKVEVIAGADVRFQAGLSEITTHTVEWLDGG